MDSGVFFSSYRADMALRNRPLEKVRMALFVAFVLIFPFVASPYWLNLANTIAIYTVGALGLNILVGYTGQISLGQGAFMAVGAYGAGLLTRDAGFPFLPSLLAASLITAAVGVVFGLPSLRLKGLYLAVATLAAQQIVEWLITHTPITGGTQALILPAPTLFGLSLRGDFRFYWVALLAASMAALYTANLFRSRVGRAFVAIRDQDIAASAIGVSVFKYKLIAFATSSFFVGMSGALLAHWRTIVTYERFTLIDASIPFLAMVIIGGLGSISGSFFGATFMVLLPAMITTFGRSLQSTAPWAAALLPAVQQGVFGVVVILFLVLEPEGLAKLWRNIKDYFHVWPFSY